MFLLRVNHMLRTPVVCSNYVGEAWWCELLGRGGAGLGKGGTNAAVGVIPVSEPPGARAGVVT